MGSEINDAERLMWEVVDACTDCDCCMYLMDTNCLFFPVMYKLWDREKETGERITHRDLRHLADLCNYCALCPCPNIREDIITAKTLFVDRDGLDPYIRTLENVERAGKLCGAVPWLFNFFLQSKLTGNLIKKSARIHTKRKVPLFPNESFPAWAKRHKLNKKSPEENKRKFAYFSGCTARFLFPEVAIAAINVLQQNSITVYYPEQNCCSMLSMLEGDRKVTLMFSERTVSHLAEVVSDEYDVVCSCPTCGYMLKKALRERAYYSKEYQELAGGSEQRIKIPVQLPSTTVNSRPSSNLTEPWIAFGGHHMSPETTKIEDPSDGSVKEVQHRVLNNSFHGLLKDDGYFSGIDPLKRIKVAENTYDLGEYLLHLHRHGELDTQLGPVPGQMAYYPPCHQREQGIGTPYMDLLALIPEISIEAIQSIVYCCGIGGIMGFKRDFHNASIQMGSRLMAKIKRLDPDHLITDCLSVRLQFNQMSAYLVSHPIEILFKSYTNH